MATSESPIVIGVFRDHHLAEQAVDELRHAGFRDDQIRVSGQGAATGGFLDTLMSKLSGHENGPGSFLDTLLAEGVPRDEAEYYQHEYEAGRTIVTVESYGHQQEASDILYHYGAYNAYADPGRLEDTQTLHLREEVLQPHKQPVEIGEVYITKRIVTEEKTITVPVMREELIIERRPISDSSNDSTNPPDAKVVEIGEDEVIRIPVRAEQVIVEKHSVVTEELIVGKRKVEETRQFTGTVQKEVPHVEREGDVKVHGAEVEDVSSHPE